MGNTLLASIAAMAVFSAGLFVTLERPSWMPLLGQPEEPILIFLVGDADSVAIVKRAIDPSRIVAETPDAIALVEGRMIVSGPEAVSQPLTAAGWVDREIELIPVPKARETLAAGKAGNDSDDPRFERLMELMNKPTLSQGEALFVMQAMNDGVLD